jgi:hypothetical protein
MKQKGEANVKYRTMFLDGDGEFYAEVLDEAEKLLEDGRRKHGELESFSKDDLEAALTTADVRLKERDRRYGLRRWAYWEIVPSRDDYYAF